MKRISRLLAFLLALCLLPLCGCEMGASIDELYSLPQLSDEYLDLQHAIDGVLSTGAGYAAPVGGTHRQSVQLYDVNGDGTDEALAFFSTTGEKPLKIYVFIQTESAYEKAAVIEGDGRSIESIDYLDMDGDGWSEIVVGWGMGGDLKMLNLYSLKGFQVASIATSDYTKYISGDMDGNGWQELMVLRQGSSEVSGTVTLYSVDGNGETVSASDTLSAGLENFSKVSCGTLKDKKTGLFVEGNCQGGLVTDIFVYRNGELDNITMDGDTGVSGGTLRNSTAAFRDLNENGCPLVPVPRALNAQSETVYRVLDWYSYNSRGRRSIVCTTYHNYTDSWYLTLPDSWGDSVTIRREDSDAGERGVVFSLWNGEGQPVTDFLVIYALSGENRGELARKAGRSTLYVGNETIYSAELRLSKTEWSEMPELSELRERFHLIYSEWIAQ